MSEINPCMAGASNIKSVIRETPVLFIKDKKQVVIKNYIYDVEKFILKTPVFHGEVSL